VARPPYRAGLLLLALVLPLALPSVPATAEHPLPVSIQTVALGPPPADLLAELEAEHVLISGPASESNGDGGGAQAFVLFQRPRLEVLRLLASTPRQKEYRPELTRLEVIEASERGDVAEYRVRFMLTTLVYRARHGWDLESGRVWWTLDPSFDNDMQVLDGLWELRELDARRTLGRFTTRIHLGPALPAFLQDYATRKQLPSSMEKLRRWVDSGGRWRP
jgi:hypothetical protein